jgi:glycosyltransferase involved in cell wall biosynthesis
VPIVLCPPGRDGDAGTGPVAPARPLRGERRIELCSIGAVTRLKGLLDGLAALAATGSSGFRWTLIGSLETEPDYVAELQRGIAAHGLGDRIELLGQRPHAEAMTSLRRSDWLLLPSHTENYPLVAREALAAGVPVIGYDAGGVRDVVRHDQSGLLAPPLDVARLTELLSRAFSDSALRARLARAGRDQARRWPSWERARADFVSRLDAAASGWR